jgi:hypothetical protein
MGNGCYHKWMFRQENRSYWWSDWLSELRLHVHLASVVVVIVVVWTIRFTSLDLIYNIFHDDLVLLFTSAITNTNRLYSHTH